MNEAADLVKELRIDCEALRVGIEILAGRPETAAIDKDLIALKGLADGVCDTVHALEEAISARR
jgi:hypothetical protein